MAKKSIAVLPFKNMSADPDSEYFSDGLSESIINALGRIRNFKVVARTSAFSFKGKDVDVREVGRQLGVGHILEGGVQKTGERLRITAQLIDAADGCHLWSERYDRRKKRKYPPGDASLCNNQYEKRQGPESSPNPGSKNQPISLQLTLTAF
jgi:TolB-like protein